ncbi:hypothetical protein [Segniliparus rugosus]|uniref:Death on curing protein n=1 Tax=Segniliparus rugosus (strain ATCC BAA-974 / DSM 45345 / CCUG 50838 / CIP 108380 / JCM 13579 / CDC 945) TaxID=679197 RepID=U1LMA9_SEGRC|nr:hypothetical protein [Segniliparus rugosus]ERG69106.1 hypothetical protein HMPREF9336_04250 [Segniliparus rugosus ATCC BAA-974]
MTEASIDFTDQEVALVTRAAHCSEALQPKAFVREAAVAVARRRLALAEAVERVCDRSRPVLELIARSGDEAPEARPARAEWPPVPSAPPLDEDEVRWAARAATGASLAVFDQGVLDDVLAEHAVTDGLDVFERAATFLVGLATRAPFVRANRRAAWAAATAFLDLSGFRFHSWGFDEEAAVRIVLDAAEDRADRDQVAQRLRAIWLGAAPAGSDDGAEER